MKPFIQLVIEDLLKKKVDFSTSTLVFPSKRPLLFFKNTIKKVGYSGILPNLITIEEWIEKITESSTLSGINLWLCFYSVYCKSVTEPKSFDDFLKFAPTSLNDFNDLDKSMAETHSFFYALVSAERIEKWGSLDWENNTEFINSHIFFWREMKQVYENLTTHFIENKKGYDGFLYKQAFSLLPQYLQKTNESFVFLGFNALTPVEEKIFTYCLDNQRAKVYWETDEYYLNNKNQEAGQFFRKYKNWNYYQKNEFSFVVNYFKQEKEIKTYSVPNRINQAKLIGNLLQELSAEELEKTTLVLADENMLIPVLNSLPKNVENTNITMGFGLKYLPISFFFDCFLMMHQNRVEKSYYQKKFYYADVFRLFESSFIPHSAEVETLIQWIKQNNYSFISPDFIEKKLENSQFNILFQAFETTEKLIQHLIDWIDFVLQNEENEISELNQEALLHFHQLFIKLRNEINQQHLELNFNSLYHLYQTLKNAEKLSFIGEPLIGLQIVGMLETRLLNNERIILASVNEGIVSPPNNPNSLVPYDIRKNFNLTTHSDKDAIYAYHFYRLLQNAKQVDLIYTTSSDDMGIQEKSRFITQIELESKTHKIKHIQASPEVLVSKEDVLIEKTPFVLQQILDYFKKGVSASSINAYVRNPLDFYFSKVLGVNQTEELEVDISHKTIGTVVHNSLEVLYKPYLNKILLLQDIDAIENKITEIVNYQFKQIYKEGNYASGKNHLVYRIVLKMVERFVEIDKKLIERKNELVIISLEEMLEAELALENNQTIKIRGKFDRIDSLNGTLRIVDYKTGNVEQSKLNITDKTLQSISNSKEKDKAVQLILYAYLYLKNNSQIKWVQAGIYSARNIKSGFLALDFNKTTAFDLTNLAPLLHQIEQIILEILNPEIPFTKEEIFELRS